MKRLRWILSVVLLSGFASAGPEQQAEWLADLSYDKNRGRP